MGGKMEKKVTEEQIDNIIKKYKNKKGDFESETILIDNNGDRKEANIVSVWGCTADISKIAARCRKAIISIRDDADGCNLEIQTNAFRLRNQADSESMIVANANGAVELYHDNSKKLETASGGVTVTGTVAATSYTGDGSALTGIEVGLSTTAAQVSGITTVIDLSKDDIRLDCTGLVTIDTKGGSEGTSHSLRLVNVGLATVSFNSYFKFPSGGAPILPTASGAISMISFTVHKTGAVGVATEILAGSSVNFS